jgi:hypothetical protein
MDLILSGENNFERTILEQIIVDAFERIGTSPELLSAQQIQSATRSANLLLSEWINEGLNLWSISHEMLALEENRGIYLLPPATSSVGKVMLRTSTRQLGGDAASSAGNTEAYKAFDSNSETFCNAGLGGWISYDFGAGHQKKITLIGVQNSTESSKEYSLRVYFKKGEDDEWKFLSVYPPKIYGSGDLIWLSVENPVNAQQIKIEEIDAKVSLSLSELYFNDTVQDIPLAELSESEYMVIPNKTDVGRPHSFWLNRQKETAIQLYPTPRAEFKTLFYSRIRMLDDVGSLTNLVDTPQRFFEALTAGLAFKLSVKYNPSLTPLLEALYEKSFQKAANEDSQDVPLRIGTTPFSGWSEQ